MDRRDNEQRAAEEDECERAKDHLQRRVGNIRLASLRVVDPVAHRDHAGDRDEHDDRDGDHQHPEPMHQRCQRGFSTTQPTPLNQRLRSREYAGSHLVPSHHQARSGECDVYPSGFTCAVSPLSARLT